MLKFNSNILKIKLFYLNIIGKIKKNNFMINTNNLNKNLNSILIIFPIEQTEFNVAKIPFSSHVPTHQSPPCAIFHNPDNREI